MKESIRKVFESIYDPEFPDTSHFHSGRGCHSVLRRIKEEWGTSRWFLEFDIRKSFHTIDRHRLISILLEEIDDFKFFSSIHQVFSAGQLNEDQKGPGPHSVLLSVLPDNIYLHKLDQEIGKIRQIYEIPIVERIRSFLVRTEMTEIIDDQENSGEPQGNRALIVGNIQRKADLHSFVSVSKKLPTSTPRLMGDQKRPFVFPPSWALAAFLSKLSSLLCAALIPKAEFYGGEHWFNHFSMREKMLDCEKKGLLIEQVVEAILVFRSERVFCSHLFRNLSYARYADDLLLGIVGAVDFLIEIQKRIAQFLQSGLWVGLAGSTTIAAWGTVEFLGTVIRAVPNPKRTTPIQFFRKQEKRLRVKRRIHITSFHLGKSIPIKELTKEMSERGSILDGGQLTLPLFSAGGISPQVSLSWETVKHIWQGVSWISLLHSSGRSKAPSDVQQVLSKNMSVSKLSLYTPAGLKATGEGGKDRWGSSEFPIQIGAPIKKILQRLRDRGLISRRKPWPSHVACLTSVNDGDIVNWSAGIANNLLFYYRCRDNFDLLRKIVDHQIRWSAIFTLAHKQKSSARNIIPKYSKDSNIVNQKGGKPLAEFPNNIELGKLGPGQDPAWLRYCS